MFEIADAYEMTMGRWSRRLAPLFVDFARVQEGERVLDVGCGTGSLSAALASFTRVREIVAIDSSIGFIEYARTHTTDPRVTFELGDAQHLPYPKDSFDRCMALLVIDHIPDAPKGVAEMRRVTRPAGVVATTMWDRSRDNELYGCFWDAAEAFDPAAKRPSAKRASYGSQEALAQLWKGAGMAAIETTELKMLCEFSSLDELWQRYLTGEGPAGAYMKSLSAGSQEAIRRAIRQIVFGAAAEGPFSLRAKAWAVRGMVP